MNANNTLTAIAEATTTIMSTERDFFFRNGGSRAAKVAAMEFHSALPKGHTEFKREFLGEGEFYLNHPQTGGALYPCGGSGSTDLATADCAYWGAEELWNYIQTHKIEGYRLHLKPQR